MAGFSPMMYMPFTLAGEDGVHHLHHRQAGLVVQLRFGHAPGGGEALRARRLASTRW
jgi:hypothetical protein